MGFSERIKSFFERNREKHKLSFTNDATYDEKWSFRLSMMNLYMLLGLYTILIIFGLFLMIRYTWLSELFVDAPPASNVEQINENSDKIDSLSSMIRSRQMYFDDLSKILRDEPFEDSIHALNDTSLMDYEANFDKSTADSLLREKIENGDQIDSEFSYDFFFAPVKGTISKSFDLDKGHYGVDVVTDKNMPIKSCLEGTVIFASWTPNDGDVIIIQHNNDFTSVYKHCSSLLKKAGEKVQTADPLAIVGNSGEHTSGPHLHFEIWKKGIPVNPQEFINFQK